MSMSMVLRTVVARTGRGEGASRHGLEYEGVRGCTRSTHVVVTTKALQNFGEDEVANDDWFQAGDAVGQSGFPGPDAVEVIDPDRGIDNDHRSRRISSS